MEKIAFRAIYYAIFLKLLRVYKFNKLMKKVFLAICMFIATTAWATGLAKIGEAEFGKSYQEIVPLLFRFLLHPSRWCMNIKIIKELILIK